MTEDTARLRPSDWLPAVFDVTDVERFLVCWVVPRLGPDVWLEDVDVAGPPEHWMEVLDGRDVDELVDMVAVCKKVCARLGVAFERVLENVRHRQLPMTPTATSPADARCNPRGTAADRARRRAT